MDPRALVGLNIQRLRRSLGVSQEELALRAGSTRAYLSGIETGRRNPSVLKLDRLAAALGVDLAEFFVAHPSRNNEEAALSKPAPKPVPEEGQQPRES